VSIIFSQFAQFSSNFSAILRNFQKGYVINRIFWQGLDEANFQQKQSKGKPGIVKLLFRSKLIYKTFGIFTAMSGKYADV
jgi:hypothetical protein